MSGLPHITGFSPPPGDYVSHMLGMIFGPLWTEISKHGLNLGGMAAMPEGPFGAGFFVFNTLIFSFVTLYIVKMIFEGIAGTAYHGEWLGKKFHTFWTPLRIIMMLALVLPVAGGLSIAQVVVLWVAHDGIGTADQVSKKMMSVVSKQGAVYSNPVAPSARKVASSLFLDYVCADTLNDSKLTASKRPFIRINATGNKKWYEINFSGAAQHLPQDTCGSVRIPTPPTQIAIGEAAGTSAMLKIIKPAARQFERNATSGQQGNPLPPDVISNAAHAYTSEIMKSVRKYAQKKNSGVIHSWRTQEKEHGFAVLGDFMTQIAAFDGKISKLARFQPSVTPPLRNTKIGLTGIGLRGILGDARKYIQVNNPERANPTGMPATLSKSEAKGKGWFAKKKQKLINYENEIIADFNNLGSSNDPLGALQAFGVKLTTASSLTIGVVSVVGGIAEIVAMPAVLALFGVLFPLLMLGLTMAYIIPLLPYLIYSMAVIGWVAAVVTAVAGASLWAAVHAVPDDNEGFVPRAAVHGYRLLLSIFAKPTLIVFGFVAGLVLFDAGGWYVNKTFLYAARTVLGGSSSNSVFGADVASLCGIGTMIFMCVVIYWKLADWSFGITHTLPDRALEWMGLSDISTQEEKAHDTMIGAVVAGHRETRGSHEHALRHTNADERAQREHARAAREKSSAGQADQASGPAGDT